MTWQPNRWIAIALNIVLIPAGLLYVGNGRWALYYALMSLALVFAAFFLLDGGKDAGLLIGLFNILILVSTTIHTYRIAGQYDPSTLRPWYSHWYGIAAIYLTLIIPIVLVRAFFFEPFKLPSASMAPSFPKHTQVIITKFGFGNYGTYGFSVLKTKPSKALHHGDVIVFSYPREANLDYMKRVIGLPRDTIEYRYKQLWINGKPVVQSNPSTLSNTEITGEVTHYDVFSEALGTEKWKIQNIHNLPENNFKITVPEHMYFVMGDNRDQSNDSRFWGYVPESAIKGKVILSF
jgi:signal peptidase I